MQQVIDLVNNGANTVVPFLKGVFDIVMVNDGKETKEISKKVVEPVIIRQSPIGVLFNRHMVRAAGVSGALAVALGAYGSHVIEMNHKIDEDRKRSFRSANLYHFIGTFGLVASSLARKPIISGTLMGVGTLIFCSSCYTFAMTGEDSYKKFAPFGGTLLIVAWLSLVL